MGADKGVGGVLDFPVGGAVNVVHEEAQHLLEGDVDGAEGQPLLLAVVEGVLHLTEVTGDVGAEAVDVHTYAAEILVVLGTRVGVATSANSMNGRAPRSPSSAATSRRLPKRF